ncbi:cytochrome P450 CYP82D47-like protein [Tanacetum coccineum]
MDVFLLLIILLACLFCFILRGHLAWIRNRVKNGLGVTVPEAAGSWPIIGHLHLFSGSQIPHRLLGSMAEKLGPIFTIKLGVYRILIVTNSEMAKECLTTNDRVFASRPKATAVELMGYNYAMFAFAPHGSYWREMRKISVIELASHHQTLASIRVSEVKLCIVDMYRSWLKNKGSSEMVMVDMKEWLENFILDMVLRMLFGSPISSEIQNADQFKNAIKQFLELLGAFVPSDIVPCLKWLDLGGYEKKMKKTSREIDVIVDEWLQVHNKKMKFTPQVDRSKDQVFMATLLSRVKEELKHDLHGFSVDAIVKSTCLAIFAAASHTTTVTLTWAIALLVNNPLVLKKAQQELEHHVGRDREVEDSDLKNLVYIQAIIKETLRLYPIAPLSAPHESTEDCMVGGYTVPKGTLLLVNIWNIHHDSQIWTDPFKFEPERFLTSKKELDVKGQHFEFFPFGSGRRMCVGISFALEALQYILASIIHAFELQNPSNEPIDMTESPGFTTPKATPLELLVAPRLSPHLYGEST